MYNLFLTNNTCFIIFFVQHIHPYIKFYRSFIIIP